MRHLNCGVPYRPVFPARVAAKLESPGESRGCLLACCSTNLSPIPLYIMRVALGKTRLNMRAASRPFITGMPISKYNQIRPHRLRDANCLLPIRGLATHFKISFTREDLGEDLSDKAIVVNDQNTAAVRLFLGRRVVSVATTSCSRRTPFMHAGEISTRGL